MGGLSKQKIFRLAKGFRGRAKNCITIATRRVEKALTNQGKSRMLKKRDFRSLWIQRINAGVREYGMKYASFIHGLQLDNIQLNRKVLANLATYEPYTFKALTDRAQVAVEAKEAQDKIDAKTNLLPTIAKQNFRQLKQQATSQARMWVQPDTRHGRDRWSQQNFEKL
mmetsp:Transcript_9997/g.11641  ORF Transcript_9997/g.11641 Transcript_9997/m.11641 type:complete len:168 (+) Transcript_9997:102-605(+)|eukprot:CAMPEP_0197850780 /NCGR_PEP_ID=MMETSP1438-20131217/16373_1 /TAXON_ID=1461541 /ORGANISM="Pterosperma sp., Strain CCMP1384" /LENGTH=167 /DNA_ID=CAMNT_0043464129 /DNA_START=91 /DNA_END=594 /DNA_ORIENTATION=-